MKFRIKVFLLGALVLTSCFVLSAQQTENRNGCGRTETSERFDISVWSSKKGYVKGLTEKNFEVYFENERQNLEFFAQKEEPASIGVLFDLSDSMEADRGRIKKISAAVDGFKTFLKNSNPGNEYFFVTFAKEKSVLLDFTADQNEIQKVLDKIQKSELKELTIFFDAVKFGYEKLLTGKHSKKVLLLVTDGMDNASKTKLKEIKTLIRQENIPIYAVDIVTEDSGNNAEALILIKTFPIIERTSQTIAPVRSHTTPNPGSVTDLDILAYGSGGRVFYPLDAEETAESFKLLAEELKTHYTLCFTPKDSKKTDEGRKLEIKLNLSKEEKKGLGTILVRPKKGLLFAKTS